MTLTEDKRCACGSGRDYAACCGPLHGGAPAATAEALMRSRYCAYALGLEAYLLATWHADTRPATLDLATGDAATRWLGLDIREQRSTGADSALVEFVARYRLGGGSAKRLHERSRFAREGGRWYYLDGEFP
ncbi:MAG: YchJ family protein [Nevskia sp.]